MPSSKLRIEMKNTLLFGNGFNRISNDGISWEDILNNLKKENTFHNGDLPYTMIYEKALFDSAINLTYSFLEHEFDVKTKLAELMKDMKPSKIYDDIISLKLDNYLTTNYDYCLKTLLTDKYKFQEKNTSTEDIYSIRRKTKVFDNKGKEICKIWNIHGEIEDPQTIMLGYDHYTGSLGKIGSYVKGHYEFFMDREGIKPVPIKRKLVSEQFDDYSWIEQFFNSNVHIVGLKLDYSETDIYWILNKRNRIYRELNDKQGIRNKIYFYTNEENSHKSALLKSFGVEVKFKKVSHTELYEYAINEIAKHK